MGQSEADMLVLPGLLEKLRELLLKWSKGDFAEQGTLGAELGFNRLQIAQVLDYMAAMGKNALIVLLLKAGVGKEAARQYAEELKMVLDRYLSDRSSILDKILQVIPFLGYLSSIFNVFGGRPEHTKGSLLKTTNVTVAFCIICTIPYLMSAGMSTFSVWATSAGVSAAANFTGSCIETYGAVNWVKNQGIRQQLDNSWKDIAVATVVGGAVGTLLSSGNTADAFCHFASVIGGEKFQRSAAGYILQRLSSLMGICSTTKLSECLFRGAVMTLTKTGLTAYKHYAQLTKNARHAIDDVDLVKGKLAACLQKMKEQCATATEQDFEIMGRTIVDLKAESRSKTAAMEESITKLENFFEIMKKQAAMTTDFRPQVL